jgi:hypothetical protein
LLKGSSDIVVGLFFDNAISAIRVIVSPAAEGKEFARSLSASPSAAGETRYTMRRLGAFSIRTGNLD